MKKKRENMSDLQKAVKKKQGKPKKMRTKAKEKGTETRSSEITTNICC